MTEDFILQYFENVAAKLIAIGHTTGSPSFFRVKSKVDLDAFDNSVRGTTKSNVLLLETGAGATMGWDSTTDMLQIGLHCLVKTDESFANILIARDLAKTILLKIVSRMRLDCEPLGIYSNGAAGPLWGQIATFDSACKYDDMDGIDGNWYGKAIYFTWKVPLDLSYNGADWTG
jgi:hypothetical protein